MSARIDTTAYAQQLQPTRQYSNRLAETTIYSVLLLLGIISVLPILHTVNASLSSPEKVAQAVLLLWPQDFTLDSYIFIFKGEALIRSFGVTVFITVVGTALNLLVTAAAAYPLSRQDLPGRRSIMLFIMVTFIFHAGIVPGFILVRSLGLINSLWAMIWPTLVNVFYLILLRNFFENLPDSVIESARMDGASELRILFQIVIPMSLPAIATMGLFYAVSHWNEFFRGIFYIYEPAKWPLQVLLRSVVIQANLNEIGFSNQDMYGNAAVSQLTIRAATVIAAIVPMALLYPFVQRFFVQGIVLGAEKG